MISSSRFNLDDFCIMYDVNNLETHVYKHQIIHLQQVTELPSQIIAVTIFTVLSVGGETDELYVYSQNMYITYNLQIVLQMATKTAKILS